MRLDKLLEGSGIASTASAEISWVCDDSRRVTKGCLFAALDGPTRKGEEFIETAIAQGAAVVLLKEEARAAWAAKFPQVVFLGANDPRKAFHGIALKFFGNPSDKVRVLGVTGTNGKTTITYFLESILAAAGKRSGVVGTVNYRVGVKVLPSKNTTPGFLDNQIFLSDLAKDAVDYAVMEVSSHALAQGRVDGIDFKGGLFTNLTGDHLDYHKTMDAYFEAKSLLFRNLSKNAFAVINADDPYGQRLTGLTRARVLTYGLKNKADITAHVREFEMHGTHLDVKFQGQSIELRTHFIGYHNIYNMLAAFAAGIGEGIDPAVIKQGIESLIHVPGRLERVECDRGFAVFIDYAHTDDGLRNVLECLKEVPHKRLIAVFGCGGDRDRTKRPRMGKVAGELADYAVVTSDNPRSEDPQSIINEIIPGFPRDNWEAVVDREEAIGRALRLAKPGDIVLLAGKGHETYQILKDGQIDFVESEIVRDYLKAMKTGESVPVNG